MPIQTRQLNPQVTLLDIRNAQGSATLSLFGGQVLSFIPAHDRRERLFLSPTARLDGSKSIRGGIPLCWPWFGAHQQDAGLPAHGYIRTRQWQVVDSVERDAESTLLLQALDCSGPGFAGSAQLQLRLTVGASLQVELLTTNTGARPFPLSAALHTYFAADDIHGTELRGLRGRYSDKTRDWAHFDTPVPYRFTEETDRIHLEAAGELQIVQAGGAVTHIASAGHDSIVVWNPWTACADNFPDLEPEGYARMLCVETALTQGFALAPGETHALVQTIS